MPAIIWRSARRADLMLYQHFLSVRPRENGDPGAISAFTRVFDAPCTRTSQSLGHRVRGDERRMLLFRANPGQLDHASPGIDRALEEGRRIGDLDRVGLVAQ